MLSAGILSLPFFSKEDRDFASGLDEWAASLDQPRHGQQSVQDLCRQFTRALGEAGWLKVAVPTAPAQHSVRLLCIARDVLAYHGGLLDFSFAMQGLGTGPITLFGSEEQKARYLPGARSGTGIAAFALSEPDAGSDVSAIATTATPDGNSHVRLNGQKTWISNGGIASQYVVFARTGEAGAKGLSAFIVDAHTPGLEISDPIEIIAPHPLATLTFKDCRIPLIQRIGEDGQGFKIAMGTLDVFRTTVGAAGLGMARRALAEALAHAQKRQMFGKFLADFQLTQAALADMATSIDAASLLVYRAAWTKDETGASITREAAMAKMFATESAQSVIDRAVQMFGGRGVESGAKVEELYREIRALRIYEGATEVQKLIIARDLLKTGP